jgi:hypothetical protein
VSDDFRNVVAMAIGASGQVGSNEREWHMKVARNAAAIAAMMREPHDPELASTPLVTVRKVLEASVFKGEFVGYREDENMKRLFVQIRSESGDAKEQDADGVEELRTEPWWTEAGFVMRRAIENLAPGTPINVYKYNEPIEGGRKNTRVLVHFQVVGKPRTQAGAPQPAPASVRAPQQDSPTPAAAPPHAPGGHADLVATRFEALSSRQRVAFGRLCASQGLTDFMDPSDEHLDAVLVNMAKIEQNNEGASA